MIVVMPNAYTRYQGSMHSSSVVTGDWEAYIAKGLVAYIESHYRTLPNLASRGLAGHSMGGYGIMRIGMKYPRCSPASMHSALLHDPEYASGVKPVHGLSDGP